MTTRKKAIITGVTGQDGSYLSELLLEKEYDVVGIKRRSSTNTDERISHLYDVPHFRVVEGDVVDPSSIYSLIEEHKPHEIYNLAAQSHVGTSFQQPYYTFQVNTLGLLNILEGVRKYSPSTKIYQASTSEMFGTAFTNSFKKKNAVVEVSLPFQNEDTVFKPNSPYAVAKTAAHHLVANYRNAYGLFVCAGILFNHEAPRRGEQFVTRKITKWIGNFYLWRQSIIDRNHSKGLDVCCEFKNNHIYLDQLCFPRLALGNLSAQRDWGHAKDYVRAMHLMLQLDNPADLVIATGETRSVRDFLTSAFKVIGIDDWTPYIYKDPQFMRPSEVPYLCGSPALAIKTLGWRPEIPFEELVEEMVLNDIQRSTGLTRENTVGTNTRKQCRQGVCSEA